MVVVCSLSEREEILRREKNEDKEKEEEDDRESVKEKKVEKDTEVEEETVVEKLYRTIGQDEEEEEMFRKIQEKKDELRRRLQEKKAKLLSWGTRVDNRALWTIMMSQLRASTVHGAVQRRKNKKRRRRTILAVSPNNLQLGTSDQKGEKRLQGQEIESWKSINDADTAPCTKDQVTREKTVSAPVIRNSQLKTTHSLHQHRTQDKQKKFRNMYGAVYWTGPDIKGLFLTILMVLFMTLSSGQKNERPAYCHISPEPIAQEWKLSCQFQVDLRERRQDFQVFQVKRDGSPDLVVDGTWIEDEIKAYTADGYVLDGSASDQLVIMMQNRVVHSGQIYTCTLPSTPLENVKTCQVPKKETYSTAMLHTPPAVYNGVWRPVNYGKILLLIAAAITCEIISKHV